MTNLKTSESENIATVLSDFTLQEAIRTLFLYGAEYIYITNNSIELLCHQEKLISLFEKGHGEALIKDIASDMQAVTLQYKASLEEELQDKLILYSCPNGIKCLKIADFRKKYPKPGDNSLPEWWSIPLPLLHYSNGRLLLNPSATQLIPDMNDQLILHVQEAIVSNNLVLTIKKSTGESILIMNKIDFNNYYLEDISDDAKVAEELVWWASIGQTLVSRMEKNGLRIGQHRGGEKIPEGSIESLLCTWEGEQLGVISILPPPSEQTPISRNSKKKGCE